MCWRLDEPEATVAALSEWLTPQELDRAANYTRDEPRRRFIVGRGRLRELLGRRLGVCPAEVAFRYGPAGKPELVNDSSLGFNLAHSAEFAVCAIADHPVGVDLERRRPMKNAPGLAERWFHPEEQRRIAAAADPLAEFFRTWTMKEAALKLVGVGVGESLPRVLTPDDPGGGQATGLPANALGLRSCRVEPIQIDVEYTAAIASP